MVKKQWSKSNTVAASNPSEDPAAITGGHHDTSAAQQHAVPTIKDGRTKLNPASEDALNALIEIDTLAEHSQRLSAFNDHSGDLKDAYHSRPLRIYAHVLEGGTCLRANNLYSYCELNRSIPRLITSVAPGKELVMVHPQANVEQKAQVRMKEIADGFPCACIWVHFSSLAI